MYVPVTCMVSLLYFTEDGASSEIAVVGYEGMVGVSLFMGADRRRAGVSCNMRVKGSA